MHSPTLRHLAIYCFAATFGFSFAVAQQQPDNKSLRDSPDAPKFASDVSNGSNGSTTGPTGLPTWTGGFTYKGTAYTYTMVGSDPTKTCSTTVVPVYIVPLKLIYSDGTVFDPTAM